VKSFDQQVADWARTKPADEAYDYTSPCGCALFQFMMERGYPVRFVYAFHWVETGGQSHWFNDGNRLAFTPASGAVAERPWTFGALADRLSV
jgi:hypothetical protein